MALLGREREPEPGPGSHQLAGGLWLELRTTKRASARLPGGLSVTPFNLPRSLDKNDLSQKLEVFHNERFLNFIKLILQKPFVEKCLFVRLYGRWMALVRTESFSRTRGQEPVSLHCPLGGLFTGFILHCAQKHCEESQVQAGPLPIKSIF